MVLIVMVGLVLGLLSAKYEIDHMKALRRRNYEEFMKYGRHTDDE